jgi:hypothetical protein
VLVDGGALLGLGQAGALRGMQGRLGGWSARAERGQKKRRKSDQSGNRHGAGFKSAPVNAG